MNESCSASVKTDLLRRLRRLNQGQRRATRVDPDARCCYGMCLMPLAGPPRELGGDAGGGGGVLADRNRPVTAGRGWGRGRAREPARARGGGGGRGGGGAGSGRGGGTVVFPCGHMFHEYCLSVARDRGSKGKRSGSSRGRGTGGVVCCLCGGKEKSARR